MHTIQIFGVSLQQFFFIYLLLTFLLTCFSIARMYLMRDRAGNRKKGAQRIKELAQAGRFRQIPLYDFAEQQADKNKQVVKLSVFPAENGERRRYAVICPGGGYAHLVTKIEGFPIAAKLNEMGYTAFVLEYRTGRRCTYHAPMHDLAAAIRYIDAHADEFSVQRDDYAIIGFSAGGNLAGIMGSQDMGYAHYGLPKPGVLIMGYPWTNINHWFAHPYWNLWAGLMGIWLSERGNFYLFGPGGNFKQKNRDSVCLQKRVTPDFPPTYMFAGGNDVLVPAGAHTDVMAAELKKHGVPYLYEKFFAVPHGVGLGEHTAAEGWLENAAAFWEEQIDAE